LFGAALEENPAHLPALVGWASLELGRGTSPAAVAERLAGVDLDEPDAGLLAALADARRLAGDEPGARRAYDSAFAALPPFAHDARASMRLRASLPPDAIRLVHVPGHHAETALALERAARATPGAGAAWYFAADRWLAAGRPDRALAAMRAMELPEDPAARAAVLAARARTARAAGRPRDAAADASAAATTYVQARLHAPALQQRDRAAEARWVASR
jgi:hypothetical protein